MFKKYWWVIIFLILVGFGIAKADIGIANAQETWQGEMHVACESVDLFWTDPDDSRITHYEVQAVWIDQDPNQYIDIGTTTSTSMTVQKPRTGHFYFRARSVGEDSDTGETIYSEWSTTIEDTSDGVADRVYFCVPSVDGVTIE